MKELESWGPTTSLDLRHLTLKLAMLLALGSAFRAQSISLIKLDNLTISRRGVEIRIKDLIKTSRPGADHPHAIFNFFENEGLCIARTLLHYLEVTKNIRGETKRLLISFKKPHGEIGVQTISRWLKIVLKESGIDEEFTAHSTRHAATSKAATKGLDINVIKNAAGWSENSQTFSRFYNRPIKSLNNNFAESILDT